MAITSPLPLRTKEEVVNLNTITAGEKITIANLPASGYVVEGDEFIARGSQKSMVFLEYLNVAGTANGSALIYVQGSDEAGLTLIETISINATNNTADIEAIEIVGRFRRIYVKLVLGDITSMDVKVITRIC